MKPYLFICLFLLLTAFFAAAQTSETVRVSTGDDLATAVSVYGIYRFPAFTTGTILLKDGRQGKELLNYNILNDEMMYIDKKGDTLAIGIPDQIKKITINGTDFYYDKKESLEEISKAATISLVIKRRILIDYQKERALGVSSGSGGSIDTYATLPGVSSYHLVINEDAIVRKRISYFLLTAEGRQLPATRANFISVFIKNKENIEAWLSNHTVNFHSEPDLVQLFRIAAAEN